MATVKELEAQLAEARALEEEERSRLAALVKPVWKFYLQKYTPKGYDVVYDDTCTLYTMAGELQNETELKEVGHYVHSTRGSMQYIYNELSAHFVMAVGGGTIYTSEQGAWDELSEFITEHPEGGEVTEIVNKYRTPNQRY